MSYAYQIKQAYSFQVYPSALLGTGFQNVTVLAVMDQETANRETDTQAQHVQVYPTLPAGTPNDPAQYNYLKVRMPNGSTTILGMAWIKEDTIVQVTTGTIVVKITSSSPAADLAKVRNALLQNGFTAIDLSIAS